MFKVGDRVICINNTGCNLWLTTNKSYNVIIITDKTLKLIDDCDEDCWFNITRFKLDLKWYRQQKLKDICLKSEIN